MNAIEFSSEISSADIHKVKFFLPLRKSNGTMSVLTGSHKIGFIKKVKNVKLSKKSINSFVPKNITALKKKYSEKFINMNLRDVVLFNENIIHKTNNNISNKIRFACIIRFAEIIDKVTK